jgi:hypothetical protein
MVYRHINLSCRFLLFDSGMQGEFLLKNINSIVFLLSGAGFLYLLPFSARADSLVPVSQERKNIPDADQKVSDKSAEHIETPHLKVKRPSKIELIQRFRRQQLAEQKYTRIVAIAGNKLDELAERRNEAINANNKLHRQISTVKSYNPSYQDYKEIEAAANAYSLANKYFIDLQKYILAQSKLAQDTVAIEDLYAAAAVSVGMK